MVSDPPELPCFLTWMRKTINGVFPYLCLFPVVEQEDRSAQADEGKNRDMLDKKAYFFLSVVLSAVKGLLVAKLLVRVVVASL